jgi:hypothetical protein
MVLTEEIIALVQDLPLFAIALQSDVTILPDNLEVAAAHLYDAFMTITGLPNETEKEREIGEGGTIMYGVMSRPTADATRLSYNLMIPMLNPFPAYVT